jgi:hypothetical protein
MKECTMQGLAIANEIIGRRKLSSTQSTHHIGVNFEPSEFILGKGGYWQYAIGLLGKPSAGKSTFFNTATAFARQRGGGSSVDDHDGSKMLGGASMAPHPFTSINPNVGYCFAPAPLGSCPEDDVTTLADSELIIGSTHGRGEDYFQ